MMTWIGQHRIALAQTFRRLARAPLAYLLTAAVIGVALALPAGFYILIDNLHRTAGKLQGEPQISLFLARDSNRKDQERISSLLEQNPNIEEFRFIAKEAALKELEKNAGLSDMIAALERNPLPDAYVVRPKAIEPDALERLRSELQALPKVDLAQLDSAWAKRLHALLKTGKSAALILAVLLGVALLAITGNTIRLQILTQRDEIEVSRLIGATDRFIRRPFLYLGAWLGFLGGLAAMLIVFISIAALRSSLSELSQLYAGSFELMLPGLTETGAILAGATLLGWLAAFISVGHYLRRAG